MQISGLNESLQFGANDVLAIEINGVTYKLTGTTLASTLRTIGGVLPVANGGTGATTRAGAQNEFMQSGGGATTSSNPATYNAGVYSLASSSYNTTYWPAAALYGVMMVWKTSYYTEALIIGSGGKMYFGHVNNSASTPIFSWKTVATT